MSSIYLLICPQLESFLLDSVFPHHPNRPRSAYIQLDNMRLHTLLVPALLSVSPATAQQQPLFDRARSYVAQAQTYVQSAFEAAQTALGSAADTAGSAAQSAEEFVKHPVDATAAKVVERNVPALTLHNWRDVIRHSGTVRPEGEREAWMVLVTGGNKTCHGMCHNVDRAWNVRLRFPRSRAPPLCFEGKDECNGAASRDH